MSIYPDIRHGRSLGGRYLLAAFGLAALLVVGAATASWYLHTISARTSLALQLQGEIEDIGHEIRDQMSTLERALHDMVSSSGQPAADAARASVARARQMTERLAAHPAVLSGELGIVAEAVASPLRQLEEKVNELIALSEDLNWVYPALPFITGSMLAANDAFETAAGIALEELETDGPSTTVAPQIQNLFYDTKDLWRRIILNFRALLVRFSGLQNVPLDASSEEANIEQLHRVVSARLDALASLAAQGALPFQAEEAVVEMRRQAATWFAAFKEMQEKRIALYWRADVGYIATDIRPLQTAVYHALDGLEKITVAWSRRNMDAVERAVAQIAFEFWVVALAALSCMIVGYVLLQRWIVRPVANIAEALWAEATATNPVAVSAPKTREMRRLVDAFGAMRAQVAQRQEALEYQALHDALTELPNRVVLYDRLSQLVLAAHRRPHTVALLIMDLNGFKEINDTLGHQAGDIVLQQVAGRLSELVRKSDTVARLGGDEFAVVLDEADQAEAEQVAAKVLKGLEAHFRVLEHSLYIGASIGIAVYPDHGTDARTLVQRADVAMYEAKRTKRHVACYDVDQDRNSIEQLALVAELDTAISSNQLRLFYQPKIDLQTGAILGAEALLRWQRPTGAPVPPDRVVELAENNGLIGALTDWVMARALKDCAEWRRRGVHLHVAVNLSPLNLQDTSLPQKIEAALAETGLLPKVLTVEITENAVMTDPERAGAVVRDIRAMGARVAVDDFGTGLSSLSYLKQLTLNELKIDKSFVMDMNADDSDAVIVRSIIDLGHNLGLEVVAEGIENEETVAILQILGCDMGQGYAISRPVPSDDLVAWISAQGGAWLPDGDRQLSSG